MGLYDIVDRETWEQLKRELPRIIDENIKYEKINLDNFSSKKDEELFRETYSACFTYPDYKVKYNFPIFFQFKIKNGDYRSLKFAVERENLNVKFVNNINNVDNSLVLICAKIIEKSIVDFLFDHISEECCDVFDF